MRSQVTFNKKCKNKPIYGHIIIKMIKVRTKVKILKAIKKKDYFQKRQEAD